MATIPESVILIWTGSNASIPAGWTRETTLDLKHPKAWGTENPNITGGAATHTHTSPNHSHTLGAHTHSFTTDTVGTITRTSGSSNQDCGAGSHNHTGTSGAVSGGTTNVTAVTYGASSNEPPQRAVIFIKAGAGGSALATNICALFNSNTPPANWSNVTELSGRFMKGANTNADADLTTNTGSTTNSHNITHTHTTNTHTHAQSYTNSSNMPGLQSQAVTDTFGHKIHNHLCTFAAGTQAINQNTDTLSPSETVQPAYAILQLVKMGASGIKVAGIIGLWLGTVASIPNGWIVCDGTNGTKDLRDKFIKVGDPAGANGGSNTHTHAAQSHSHTGNGAHTHTATGAQQTQVANSAGTGTQIVANHTHSFTTNGATANYNAANTTANSSDNQPEYRTVAYIVFKFETLTSDNTVTANISTSVTYSQNQSSVANILATSSINNNVTANILSSVSRDGDIKANIFVADNAYENNTKACIVVIKTFDNDVEVNILFNQPQDNGSRADILRIDEINNNNSIASIVVTNTSENQVKASIVRSETYENQVKVNIVVVSTYNNVTKANIPASVSNENSAIANILTTYYSGHAYDWKLETDPTAQNRGYQS